MTKSDEVKKTAARFGFGDEWAAYHHGGPHVCVDGRTYMESCLVTDASTVMERVAKNCIRKSAA